MTDSNIQFEVQHFTLCDGWTNTWTIDEGTGPRPQTFASADEGYSRDEFRIVEVTAREVASPGA